MRKFTKAFTMVELIVTISIIAILLAIAIPQFRLYNSNLQLRKETQKFVSFIKDARMTAKTRCVDIDLYDCDTYGTSYEAAPGEVTFQAACEKKPAFPCLGLQANWVSPAYADDFPIVNAQFSTQMKAKSDRINYLRLYTPSVGLSIFSNYLIKHIMTFTPNGFRTEGGSTLSALHFRITSETTPKFYEISINEAGTCGISSDAMTSPGASGSE